MYLSERAHSRAPWGELHDGVAVVGEHRVGRGQGHAQGNGSAAARLVIRTPGQADDAIFGARRVGYTDTPTEGRGDQLGAQANSEHSNLCGDAAAHELTFGFQPRPGLVVVGVRPATQQDEGIRQGSGRQVLEALRVLPGAHHLVTAEEGGQLTHRNDRVVLNHEDVHTSIVVAITRGYLSALKEREQLRTIGHERGA